MDDAGSGLRGLRAKHSPKLRVAVRDHYDIEGLDGGSDLGGSSNLNLLVAGDNGRFVVRVYRPYVTAARLDDIQHVRRVLGANGVPCSEVVPTRDGKPWIVWEGRLVEVERYVASDAKMDSWERVEAGLPLLGRIHSLLETVTISADGRRPVFANHIAPEDALGGTLRGTRRIRGWGPTPNELRLAEAAEDLAHQVSAAEQDSVPAIPRQLVHGDYWDNNVFFRDGRVSLVNDWDFMGERARIDDLALTLFFASATLRDDHSSDEAQLERLRSLVNAYDQGLERSLSRVERAALPLALARQPLWSLGVWVALLDDESRARQHAAGMMGDVTWASGIMRGLDRWQAAFA
jgi:homoserine kinase type II